jgi:CRP-like cAMP-binding protein
MVSPELLRRYPFFGRLTLAELAALAQGASRVEAAPGEYVIREGEPARNCYLIVEGEVRIVVAPAAWATGGRADVMQGELFGWSALVSTTATPLRRADRAVLVRFSGDELLALRDRSRLRLPPDARDRPGDRGAGARYAPAARRPDSGLVAPPLRGLMRAGYRLVHKLPT